MTIDALEIGKDGAYHRVRHDADCDGWLLAGYTTVREREEGESQPSEEGESHPSDARPVYEPCHICRPGQAAVHNAMKHNPNLAYDANQAVRRRIYAEAEQDAGREVPEGFVPEPKPRDRERGYA